MTGTINFSGGTAVSGKWYGGAYNIVIPEDQKLSSVVFHFRARNGQGTTYVNTTKSKTNPLFSVKGSYEGDVNLPLNTSGSVYIGFYADVEGNTRAISDLTITYNTVDATTALKAPTSFTTNASSAYVDGSVEFTWSGAGNGTNNTIKGYRIQLCQSVDGGDTWSSWEAPVSGSDVLSTLTSGTKTYSINDLINNPTIGAKLRFRIKALSSTDSTSYDSSWFTSDAVLKLIEQFEQQPVQTMPPYVVAHIWRRIE